MKSRFPAKQIFLISVSVFFLMDSSNAQQQSIHCTDPSICRWASDCQVERGLINLSDPSITDGGTNLASYGADSNATGVADNVIVSLGDGGSATLTFDTPISNYPGYDFAVFENSFSDPTLGPPYYLELAFVEVSSDGVHFYRFDATSNTQVTTQVGPFETMDNGGLNNIAGKYTVYYGTPFDLEELQGKPYLDINNVTHVRVVDVVGCIQDNYATYDVNGNKVNDPWPTNFASSGFDLDAVAVLTGTASGIEDTNNAKNSISVYPNPASNQIKINSKNEKISRVVIFNTLGEQVYLDESINNNFTDVDASKLSSDLYIINVTTADGKIWRLLCVKE